MSEKRTGRPAHYTDEQVLEGIRIVEDKGGVPDGESVKKVICRNLGVPSSINAQSLDRQVRRLLEDLDRQRRARLIRALPSDTRKAVDEIGKSVEQAVLLHLGQDHERLRKLCDQEVGNKEADLANQGRVIAGQDAALEDRAETIARLEEGLLVLKDQLEAKGRELDEANRRIGEQSARIAVLEQEMGFEEKLRAFVQETLGQQTFQGSD